MIHLPAAIIGQLGFAAFFDCLRQSEITFATYTNSLLRYFITSINKMCITESSSFVNYYINSTLINILIPFPNLLYNSGHRLALLK